MNFNNIKKIDEDIFVVDDFISKKQQNQLITQLLDPVNFGWYYQKYCTYHQNYKYKKLKGKTWEDFSFQKVIRRESEQLTHTFYQDGEIKSKSFESTFKIFPFSDFYINYPNKNIFFNKLVLMRMRATLLTPKPFDIRHLPYHVDDEEMRHFVAIYYVLNSNGKTVIKNGLKRHYISPKKGRCLFFRGDYEHANYLPLGKIRSVINFNFADPRYELS